MFFVDTDEKTVSFLEDTTLTLAQLWSLIELMDDEVDNDEDVRAKLHPKFEPVYMRYIRSFSDPDACHLVVQLPDGHWICSCPDFIFRDKDNRGLTCIHIDYALKWG